MSLGTALSNVQDSSDEALMIRISHELALVYLRHATGGGLSVPERKLDEEIADPNLARYAK